MSDRRHFRLTNRAGKVHVSVDGTSLDELFNLSPPKDLIFFLRSANLPLDEIDQIIFDLSTKDASEFFTS
jgi:hypothetical protein